MSVSTIQVPCGCVFEAEGEMKMVSYCPGCELAMHGLGEVHSCADCSFDAGSAEELDGHIVEVHMGIVLTPLAFVFPAMQPVSAGAGQRRAS